MIESGLPPELSLCGALLVQAALAAARLGDGAATAELIDEAADLAAQVGDGNDHHRTGFGPTAVDLARCTAAAELGDVWEAVAQHEQVTRENGWLWLPTEHRAAHLIDAAHAYLRIDDPANVGRLLVEVDHTAPAEIRHRPVARDLLVQVVRDPRASARAVRIAVALGLG